MGKKAVLSEKAGSVVLTLFGVPFLAVGLLVFYFMVWSQVSKEMESSKWDTVKARVSLLKFSEDPETKVIIDHLYAEFTYEYDGRKYTSKSIFFDSLPLVSHWDVQREIYVTLENAKDRGTGVNLYVNPENPREAVLIPEFTEEIVMPCIFAAVFSLAGLGIMTGGFFCFRSALRKEKLKGMYPGEPWKWNKSWEAGIVKPERKGNLIAGFIFIMVWVGMGAIPAIALHEEFLEGGPIMYIAMTFGAFGVLFIYLFFRSIYKLRKFGMSFLKLKTFPGFAGEEFCGEIYAPFFLRPEGGFHFKVDCSRHYSTGTGDDRRSKKDVLFEERFSIDADQTQHERESLIIPVKFAIPPKLPDCTSNEIIWTLNAYADTTGIDWSESYRIPVFNKK